MVRIITDSSTLITAEEAEKMGIDMIPLCVTIGDMEGRDLAVDMDDFYGRIAKGEIPRSSQPPIGDVVDVYEKYPDDEIINISMADGLSGTYQTACGAKEIVDNGENITVINTQTLCGPHRYMVQKAQEMKLDGGYATIIDKQSPFKDRALTPPGSLSARNMAAHCTGCQLCVAVCPTQVLRPSADLKTFMQPEMSYENGYCRPECNKCSQVCPTGAIKPITVEEKSSIQIGHAQWNRKNCIVITDDVDCGNCERHCPTGAITMILSDYRDLKSRKVPSVNKHLCIGCGACENLCPARPFSAIYVKGYNNHRNI